jgi:acylphosphatase
MRSATAVTAPSRSQSNLLPDGPVHLSIRGRVQGVGFRDALCDRAADLGVQGWVRNRRDGSVEALIRGERRAVEALMRWAGHGPPAARVDRFDSRPARPEEAATLEAGFRRLPTE